jgi:hypothetical protein
LNSKYSTVWPLDGAVKGFKLNRVCSCRLATCHQCGPHAVDAHLRGCFNGFDACMVLRAAREQAGDQPWFREWAKERFSWVGVLISHVLPAADIGKLRFQNDQRLIEGVMETFCPVCDDPTWHRRINCFLDADREIPETLLQCSTCGHAEGWAIPPDAYLALGSGVTEAVDELGYRHCTVCHVRTEHLLDDTSYTRKETCCRCKSVTVYPH